MDTSLLFEPLAIKHKILRNRIVLPPMVTLRDLTTPEAARWYGERSAGGTALVIVEATSVNRFGSELTAENLKPLVEAIHVGGALAAIQLFPVTIEFPKVEDPPTPNSVSLTEIEKIIKAYQVAAEICGEAGFDGVEPHGAHNYLINQFFSMEQNLRMDDFGGSIEARMEFGLRILRISRSVCDRYGMLLLYRHTPIGQGYGVDESLLFVNELVKSGLDILDVSPSSYERPGDRAAPFKRFNIPVIAVGELDVVDRAMEVLEEGRADLVAIGRGLIADPRWPQKVKASRIEDVVVCQKCDELCHGNLQLGIPVACTEW